ncbi:hypothetical protein EYF80_006691 [Liparis tanakae]|uniref:Uncharacterized protein n=1 Tax=Liparis tanakae TaxID=230148 RepID=A0A4Z2IZT2_9TELE|nr:hypothetical protein EYF80_006691 [Liparis tanakae]
MIGLPSDDKPDNRGFVFVASHPRQPGEEEDYTKKTSHSRPLLRGTPHWTGTQVSSAALWPCAGLQRYLVAVGGMALQQQRREQLDQALSAEDTALLQQKGVLEPAIPQPSSIGREAGAVARVGVVGEKERLSH